VPPLDPIARPGVGALRGRRSGGVLRFDGVPFAPAPIGAARFRAPGAAPHWQGLRSAQALRAGPLQRPGPALGTRPVGATSEDCLHLNVVTPSTEGARPVMVWIHGGGFTNGWAADPIHAGGRLVARGDVVLVTLDYRLGALGWLHDPEVPERCNVGLRDQLAALHWVQANIDAFGGDPARVTLFGESAGAMSILALMGTPAADDLFSAAILQSGAVGGLQGPDRAAEVHARFAAALATDDPRAWATLPAATLLDAQGTVGEAFRRSTGRGAWRPLLDGDLVATAALEAQERPVNLRRPLLLGTNRDEQRLFVNLRVRLDAAQARARLAAALERRAPGAGAAAEEVLAAYAAHGAGATHAERLSAVFTDLHYRLQALAIAARRAEAGAETWLYRFDRPSPALRGRLGACHALEIPFVLGTLDAPGMERFAGSDDAARRLSERMIDRWSAFARDGRPGADWAPWLPSARQCWIAADAPGCRDDVDDALLELWPRLLPDLGL
jgi:para-nitrobenzyl esterase